MVKYIFSFLFVLFISIYAQNVPGSFQIADITIEGNETISEDVIKLSSGLTKGKVIYGEDIQNAIYKLWNLELFSNIILEKQNVVGDKIYLKLILEEYPRLYKVRVAGNKEFDKEDLENEIKLYKGQTLKNEDINSTVNSLKDFYKSKNYLLAEITTEKKYIGENKVELTININEGKEVLINTITFHGNKKFENDDLTDTFDDTHEDRWWRAGTFEKDKYETDLEKLGRFYRNEGYKDFEFLKDSISFSDSGEFMSIDIWIDEGVKYYFGDVSFEGNTIFTNQNLESALEFEKGEQYKEDKFETSLYNNLTTLYYDKGYLRSQISPQEQIVGKDTVSYVFKIIEGNKARIRKINITGNTRTNEKVIRREFNLYPGDIFSKTKIMRSQRNAMMLNYFQTVIPDVVQPPVNDKEVDLVFKIKEKSTEQIQTSVSYSGTDGFVGSVGLVFNNFSFNHPFVQGDGQKLSTNVEFGKEYYKYSLGVEEPWVMDTPTLLGANINYQKKGESYSDTYLFGGSVKLGRRFAWSDNWVSGLWVYSLQRIKYENVATNAPDNYDLYEGKKIISSSMTEYITRDSRNRRDFPSNGSVLSVMTKLSGSVFGGDENFHKHRFEFKMYQPLFSKKIVLFSQYVFGTMDRIGNNSYISANQYFYLGGGGLSGGEPLRGYDENSIGPSSNGYFIGGRTLFKTSIELRFLLTDDPMMVYMLAFFDAGNLWATFGDAVLFDLKKSAGIGIRMMIPRIGMLGFDMGYGFDNYDSVGKKLNWKDQLRTHFRIGANIN